MPTTPSGSDSHLTHVLTIPLPNASHEFLDEPGNLHPEHIGYIRALCLSAQKVWDRPDLTSCKVSHMFLTQKITSLVDKKCERDRLGESWWACD